MSRDTRALSAEIKRIADLYTEITGEVIYSGMDEQGRTYCARGVTDPYRALAYVTGMALQAGVPADALSSQLP